MQPNQATGLLSNAPAPIFKGPDEPPADPKAGMLADWYGSYMKSAPKMARTTPQPAPTAQPAQPTQQAQPAQAAMPAAPNQGASVQGQLTNILDAGSPLQDRAATRAAQMMNSRGLLNSSMAVTAGQSALYDAALPIAQQDADIAARANENAAERSFRTSERQQSQGFQSGENALQRSFQSGERVSSQDFQSVQSTLDRDQQTRVQQLQEGGMDRRQAETIAASERNQRADQVFTAEQRTQDRTFTSQERQQSQVFQRELTGVQQSFQERMAALEQGGMDRRQAESLAMQEGLAKMGEMGVQNRFDAQQALVNKQFSFEQNAIDRRQTEAHARDLERMGFANTLNNQNVSTQFAASVAATTMSQVAAITGDPNLTPDAKRAAIQNLIDSSNSTMGWGAKFYNTAFPNIALPGAAPAVPGQPPAAPVSPAPPAEPAPPIPPTDPIRRPGNRGGNDSPFGTQIEP